MEELHVCPNTNTMMMNNLAQVGGQSPIEKAFFTKRQQVILVWALRSSAFLSIIGSGMIIFMILVLRGHQFKSYNKKSTIIQNVDADCVIVSRGGQEERERRRETIDAFHRNRLSREKDLNMIQNRLLLGMSTVDILNQIASGLASTPFPSYLHPYVYGAIGNATTCSIQGFFLTFGLAVPWYSAMLCVYYAAVLRWNVHAEKLKRLERYMHGVALLVPLSMAMYGWVFDLFHPTAAGFSYCWVADGCEFAQLGVCPAITSTSSSLLPVSSASTSITALSGAAENNIQECIPRPQQLLQYFQVMTLTGCLVAFAMIIISVGVIIVPSLKRYIDALFPRTDRSAPTLSRMGTIESADDVDDNETFTQALLYALGFFSTYFFPFIAHMNTSGKKASFILTFLDALFYPLQGLWNFLTYIRPRYLIVRDRMKEASFLEIITISIFRRKMVSFDVSQNTNAESCNTNLASSVHTNYSAVNISGEDKSALSEPFNQSLTYPSTFSKTSRSAGDDVFPASTTSLQSINDLSGFGDSVVHSLSFQEEDDDDKASTLMPPTKDLDGEQSFIQSDASKVSSTKQTGSERSSNSVTILDDQVTTCASKDSSTTKTGAGDCTDDAQSATGNNINNDNEHARMPTKPTTADAMISAPTITTANSNLDTDDNYVSTVQPSTSDLISPILSANNYDVLSTRRNLNMLVAQDMVIDDIEQERRRIRSTSEVRHDDGPPSEVYLPQDHNNQNT